MEDRKGTFPGMLPCREFNIVFVNPESKTPLVLNELKFDKTIHYEGKK